MNNKHGTKNSQTKSDIRCQEYRKEQKLETRLHSKSQGGTEMSLIKASSVLLTVILLVVGCASTATPPSAAIPLPLIVEITPPSPNLPPEIRAFSGKWYGVWDGILDHILVVEQINPPDAMSIYATGEAAAWNIKTGGFTRVKGKIEPGKLTLFLTRPATVTYRLKPDGTLDATYEWRNGIVRAKMKRLDQ